MKEKILFAILSSFLVFPVALASVSCPNCLVNENCVCTVTDCATGLVDIYSSLNCAGNPLYEYSFSSSGFTWFPDQAATYFALALCDDRHINSPCSEVDVFSAETTPEISTTTTTEMSVPITSPSGNTNMVLYVLVIVIIAVIAFIAYRLFSKKKKPRIDYETLYRKWGR
jgi:hypothetical protein